MNCMAWLRFRLLLSRVLLLWSMTWRRRQSRACLALMPCLPALMSLRSIEVFRPLSERSIRVGAPTLDLSSPSEWLVHSAPGRSCSAQPRNRRCRRLSLPVCHRFPSPQSRIDCMALKLIQYRAHGLGVTRIDVDNPPTRTPFRH